VDDALLESLGLTAPSGGPEEDPSAAGDGARETFHGYTVEQLYSGLAFHEAWQELFNEAILASAEDPDSEGIQAILLDYNYEKLRSMGIHVLELYADSSRKKRVRPTSVELSLYNGGGALSYPDYVAALTFLELVDFLYEGGDGELDAVLLEMFGDGVAPGGELSSEKWLMDYLSAYEKLGRIIDDQYRDLPKKEKEEKLNELMAENCTYFDIGGCFVVFSRDSVENRLVIEALDMS